MDESHEGFPQRLKRLRKEQNLLITELAYLARLNTNTISNWERSRCGANLYAAAEVAKVLGVSLDYLACVTNIK